MLGNTGVDRKTLIWIKEGVDDTLQFVQLALDEFTANTDDGSAIKTCIGALHRVKGAMEMVEIEGAKVLSTELELLGCALVEGAVTDKVEAAEVLAAGMYQLTGYLESLYHGQPDLPLILLPILNDCRACRKKALFSEGDFFAPRFSTAVPVSIVGECCIAGDSSMVAKVLRPGFLAGLLGVVTQQDEAKNVSRLIYVTENLLAASSTHEARQFWWIALVVLELLRTGELESSVAIKMLLGRVDQQIRGIIKQGEAQFTENPPHGISKNLLFYIAQARSADERVTQIKEAFNLAGTSMAGIETARENLYGFNVQMLDSVTDQLTEELLTIKDGLDIAKRSKTAGSEDLGSLMKNFSMVADILNMLGMVKHRDLIMTQKAFLEQKRVHQERFSDEELMDMATALLQVETATGHLASAVHYADEDDSISRAEYEKLLKIVAKELLDIMRGIKESMDHYAVEGPSALASLGDVPEWLKQMANVMRTINDEQQAQLADAINQYICQELILNKEGVASINLDLLADAITGLENYYQARLEESVAPELGLKVARESMATLGFPLRQHSPHHGAFSEVA